MIERQYHKGEWCKLINSTCQEGYCDCCESFLNKEEKHK